MVADICSLKGCLLLNFKLMLLLNRGLYFKTNEAFMHYACDYTYNLDFFRLGFFKT